MKMPLSSRIFTQRN